MSALTENALPMILAEEGLQKIPLHYQIGCVILTGLFILAFSITRDPRSWRRLYQTRIAKRDDSTVNKNKSIDEFIKKWGIIVAMFFLVLDATVFVIGLTKLSPPKSHVMTPDEQYRSLELKKLNSTASPDQRR